MLQALEDKKPPLLICTRWYGQRGWGRPRAPRSWPRPELSPWGHVRDGGGGRQSWEEAPLFMQIEPVAVGEDEGGEGTEVPGMWVGPGTRSRELRGGGKDKEQEAWDQTNGSWGAGRLRG